MHRRDEHLAEDMLRFARRRFGEGWLPNAMEAFFEDMAGESEDLQLFVPWAVHHWPTEGRPVREWFLEDAGVRLEGAERKWLEAQRTAVVSVWEVREVYEGEGLGVKDLLRGDECFVREVLGSMQLGARDAVLGRVVEYLGLSVFCGLHPVPLPSMWAAEVVRVARTGLKVRGRKPVPHEKLMDPEATLNLVHAWQDAELEWEEELEAAECALTLAATFLRDGERAELIAVRSEPRLWE